MTAVRLEDFDRPAAEPPSRGRGRGDLTRPAPWHDSSSIARSSRSSSRCSCCWSARCRWSQLPVGEFPNIALPTVQVNAFYLGASSDVVEQSVTAPIDQQINGATDMLYINR